MTVCERCGVLIGDEVLHREWHAAQERVVLAMRAVTAAFVALEGTRDE